jgi:hypothetical protein
MKTKLLQYITAAVLLIHLSSCVDDLDSKPLNESILTSDKVYDTAEGYRGVLAKCYGALILNGQSGPDKDGDLQGVDVGYSGYTRAMFYQQECTTDELALHAGSSQGSRDNLFLKWNQATPINNYTYYRLYMTISYCNEFLRESTDSKLKDRKLYEELKNIIPYYRAETRFIRAYCYSMICDIYGSGPFVDETMPVGIIPKQKTRGEIYDYVISETEALKNELKAPGDNEYARVDQVAAWFLLSRVYLNAQTWVGKNEFEKAYQNAKKIIDSGKYPLAPDYRYIFLADNNTCREIIWPLPQDSQNTINSAGTSALIKILSDGQMAPLTGITGGGFGSARVKPQLVDKFDLSDQTFNASDPWGDTKKDKRAQFFSTGRTKDTWLPGKAFANDFKLGYSSLKWRNKTKDRKDIATGGTIYCAIDYPMFRTADAYLMAAEAALRGASGGRAQALAYVNEIRDRAYMSGAYGSGVSGKIADSQLTLQFILDERAREFHTESVRRTDLIRFDKFTKGYNWDWKGSDGAAGNYIGKDVDDKYKLFPIPQDEFTVNPYLTQNPDFK